MNRKGRVVAGVLWIALLTWHLTGRVTNLVSRAPTIAMSATDRAALETGDPALSRAIREGRAPGPDATEFERFRMAYVRYPLAEKFDDGGGELMGIFLIPLLLCGFAGWLAFSLQGSTGLHREAKSGYIGGSLMLVGFSIAALDALAPQSAWSNWDAWAVWDFKTKAVLHEGWLPRAFLTNPDYRFAHPEYPLLWPWLQAFLSLIDGAFDTRILRLLGCSFAIVAACLIPGLLSEAGMGANRWLVAGLVATLPLVLTHSSNGYVDWPLAAVESVALLLAMRCRRGLAPGWAVGLAAGLSANLKMEGLIFGVGLLIAVAVDGRGARGGRKRLLQAAAVFVALALPWQVVRVSLGISPADFGLPFSVAVTEFPTRVFLFIRAFLLEAFGAGPNGVSLSDWWTHLASSWLLFWFVAGYAVFSGWRRLGEPSLRIPVIVVGVQILGALGAYCLTVRDVQWLLTTSLDRLMLQWVPSVTVITAVLITSKR